MATPVSWVFRILDAVTAPARAISSAIGGVGKSLSAAGAAAGDFGLRLNALTDLGSKAFGVIGNVFGRAVDLLELLGKAESTRLSFSLLLGDKGGQDLLDYLTRVQRFTAFTQAQLGELLTPLVAQGFGRDQIAELLPAALDVGAFFGGRQDAVQRALGIFAKIRSTGRVEGEAFTGLGLQEADVLGRTGASLGITGSAPAVIKAVRERISQGRVGSDVLLQSIFQAISAKTGGALGTGAVKSAGSVEALLNRIRGAPATLLESLESSPAFAGVRSFLQRLADALDPSSPFGKLVQQKAGEVFDRIVGALSRINIDDLVSGFETFVDVTEGTILVGRALIDATLWLGDLLGYTAAQVYLAGEALYDFGGSIGDALGRGVFAVINWLGEIDSTIRQWVDRFFAGAVSLGKSIVDGITSGISAGIGAVGDAITGVGEAAVGRLKGLLGIASPSRVFAELGAQTAAGFVAGLDGSSASVDAAAGRLVDVGALPVASGAGGGGFSITIGDIVIQVGGTDASAEEIGGAVREELDDMVRSLVDRYAFQTVGA